MFGKAKKTPTNKFIMSAGKKAGNFGNARGGKGNDNGKVSPDPYKERTLKVGKNSRFSAE